MSKHSYKSFLMIVVTLGITLCFQNCDSGNIGGASNNGEVYDGRPLEHGALMKANDCELMLSYKRSMTVNLAFDRTSKQIVEMLLNDGESEFQLGQEYFEGRELKEPVVISEDLTLVTFKMDNAREAMFADIIYKGKPYSRQRYCNK